MNKPLVIVHAGSFFGSADWNLGGLEADLRREYFYETLTKWEAEGPMIRTVTEIDQDVENESKIHPLLANLLGEVPTVGDIESELHDLSFLWDAQELAQRLNLKAGDTVWLTGAWYGPSGCVNATAAALKHEGYRPKIHDSALPELMFDEALKEYVGEMAKCTAKRHPGGLRLRWL